MRNLISVLAMFLVTLLAQAPTAGASTSTAPALNGTGSSLVGPAMSQWAGDVFDQGITVNWQVSSSNSGLEDFAQSQVDFGASDYTYQAAGSSTPSSPFQYVPDVAYGEAFAYNLEGTDGNKITDLVLDARVVGLIFSGATTKWNASPIKELNPQLVSDLPDTTIEAIYQSISSGDNYVLTDYLKHEDARQFDSYLSAIGVSRHDMPSVAWPVPGPGVNPTGFPGWEEGTMVGENGPSLAVDYVGAENGAIGYVPDNYAVEACEPAASVVNASGDAVEPTVADVTTALGMATLKSDLSADLEGVFDDANADAYPVSAYSYLVVACNPALAAKESPPTRCSGDNSGTSSYPARRGKELGNFIDYIVCKGQQIMPELGYAYLAKNLVKDAFAAIGRLNGGLEPPPPTQANCPNPGSGS